jgi:arthrofactin-type cyclic lipopeptide synthetase C
VSEALRDARGGDHRGHAPALALQGGASVPIVCVPGAGDSITSFVELGIALGKDQPLIGMQPRGVDGFRLPYGSVEAAAAAYLAAMSSHVPPGARVHLLGHSFGGWVVFEMARHLTAQGAKVASLTLVDTEAPDTVPGMRDETRDTIVARFLEALALRTPTPLPIDASALRGLNAQALIEALHRLMVDLKLMPARSKPDTLRGPFYSFARACRTRYCPGTPYDGPVNLVLVRDTRLDIDADAKQRHDTEQRWRAHAPALKVWHGPGNHMTILSPPNVGKLADWWRSMRPESPKDVLASSMVHLAPLIK